MYLNKAIIFGNLTRDPEMRALPSGVPVVSFAIATTRTYKDKNGVRQEDTQFHNVVFFGVPANTIAQYMKKGSSMMVEGRIQNRSWDDKDGQKKYRTEIVGENFQFGPKRDGGGAPAAAGGQPESAGAAKQPQMDTIEYPTEDINPEDIPF